MELHIVRGKAISKHLLPAGDASSVIGRKVEGYVPDIDLSPNLSVSRKHARIWFADGTWWIEDLGSRVGTLLNETEIKGLGRQPLRLGDVVRIGKTHLRLDSGPAEQKASNLSTKLPDLPADPSNDEQIKFSVEMLSETGEPQSPEVTNKLLRIIRATTMSMARKTCPADVAKSLLLGLLELVKGADHAALLFVDDSASDLILAAHEPQGDPRVSATLAQMAIDRGEAIVWVRSRHGSPEGLAASIDEQQLENVLCAPLIWQGRTLGALWLSGSSAASLTRADLGVVLTVAQQTAMAVAGQRLQEEFEKNVAITRRIMSHFSPKVATRLLDQARQGRLRPGGLESQVTLLCSDLRGFTKTTASMSADDVVDMLNEYFSELVAAVIRHGGTVDKFIGDAILAVFGSPEPDAEQHANAVLAAKDMQAAMIRVNEKRAAKRLPTLELGIGIHCGKVLHGFIGSEERVEFTVIGDAVNKTSRYCDGARPGEIVISPELHQIVWRKVKTRRAEVQTKHEGTLPVFVLMEK